MARLLLLLMLVLVVVVFSVAASGCGLHMSRKTSSEGIIDEQVDISIGRRNGGD